MILFKDDWGKYPNAIVHSSTTNTSFLRFVKTLKVMGVKNHAWPLTLIQPELEGVDPFDPRISNENMVRVINECRWNPWYYFREIARFPAKGGGKPIQFQANRGNMSMLWCFFNHIDYALIMIRQSGKSGSTDQLHNYVLNVAGLGTTIQLLTKDHQLRKSNIERIKSIREQLPDYMKQWTREDADNTHEVTCKILDNKLLSGVGQRNEDSAENLGRGLTAAILHIDEFPYIPNIHVSLPVALAGGTAARDIAKSAGGFYGNIFTTTAGKKDTPEGAMAYRMISSAMYWNERVYDCVDQSDLYSTVRSHCTPVDKNGTVRVMVNGTFSHRQLGKSDEWLREAIVNAEATGDIADRDFFNVWTSGSERSPLSPKLNDIIRSSEIDPRYTQITKEGYHIRWHLDAAFIQPRMDNEWHVITLDSSNAVGRDNNGLTILSTRDLGVVATSKVSEANILKYAQFITNLLIQYPKTVFIPENKSSGQSIVDVVALGLQAAGIDPFKRIFNRIVGETEGALGRVWEDLQRNKQLADHDYYTRYKGHFGFMTTGASRYHLYDSVLTQAATSSGHKVRDKQLIDEILSLVIKNGRVDHPSGGHDDLCVSWLLGHWFLRHGKNLAWYGLPNNEVLSEVSDQSAIMTPEQITASRERKRLRDEFDQLEEAYKKTRDASVRFQIKRRMDILSSKSLEDGGEPLNLDETMRKLESAQEVTSKRLSALEYFERRYG